MDLAFSGELPAYRCEVCMLHKSGDWVWAATQGEVTERKSFEMALQEGRAQFGAVAPLRIGEGRR